MAVVSYKDTMKRFLKSPMQKSYTFAGVTIVVILVFLFGAIRPTFVTISRLRTEIAERQIIDNALQAKITALQSLNVEFSRNEESLDLLNALYPENSDFSLLMANLERISSTYGQTLENLEIAVEETQVVPGQDIDTVAPSITRVQVRMVVMGNRSRVTDLIDHIENLPHIPDVVRVSFVPGGGDSMTDVRTTIEFYVYRISGGVGVASM